MKKQFKISSYIESQDVEENQDSSHDQLTTEDVRYLLDISKYAVNPSEVFYLSNDSFNVDLYSDDPRECFILDFHSSHIVLKYTNQCRCRREISLIRIDIGQRYHRNPKMPKSIDKCDPMFEIITKYARKEIFGPHMHIYREGYGDTWAQPLPSEFTNPEDIFLTLNQFMRKCNIVRKPTIQRGLE